MFIDREQHQRHHTAGPRLRERQPLSTLPHEAGAGMSRVDPAVTAGPTRLRDRHQTGPLNGRAFARANRDSVSIATAHDNLSGSQFLAQR